MSLSLFFSYWKCDFKQISNLYVTVFLFLKQLSVPKSFKLQHDNLIKFSVDILSNFIRARGGDNRRTIHTRGCIFLHNSESIFAISLIFFDMHTETFQQIQFILRELEFLLTRVGYYTSETLKSLKTREKSYCLPNIVVMSSFIPFSKTRLCTTLKKISHNVVSKLTENFRQLYYLSLEREAQQ